MTVAIIISVLLTVGAIGYIVHLFIRDHRIRAHGRDIRMRVEDVRHLATNENGAATIRYRLSWREDGEIRRVEGQDTISGFHASQVQKGRDVLIRYLDDDHVQFVFDR